MTSANRNTLRRDCILLTQAQTGVALGLKRSRIYILEQRALEKIKRAITKEARAAGQTVREWLYGEEE
jgi:hypothetical protein